MAKQRPSLLDSLTVETPDNTKPLEQGAAAVVQMKPVEQKTSKADVVKSTIYLPPQAHRKLKEIAFAKDCKVHDLIMQGISTLLVEHGYPTIEELKKGK